MMRSLVRTLVLAVLVPLMVPRAGCAQSIEAAQDSATLPRLAVASLIPAGFIGGIVELNQQAFWRYATAVPFHISNDPPYAMHIDKLSHLYGSALGAAGMASAYRWAGLSSQNAAWTGGLLSLAAGVALELEDARHGNDPQYGLSPGDLVGDLLGAALPVAQQYVPALERVSFKLSVWPSAAYQSGAYKTLADDYESQIYWASVDLHGLTALPPWLHLAVGAGCENLMRQAYAVPAPGGRPYTVVYLSPDIDLRGLPIEAGWWHSAASILRYVRIPLPALEVYPRAKMWVLR